MIVLWFTQCDWYSKKVISLVRIYSILPSGLPDQASYSSELFAAVLLMLYVFLAGFILFCF